MCNSWCVCVFVFVHTQYHPDRLGGEGSLEVESGVKKFLEVDAAWRILSDQNTRRHYDLQRRGGTSHFVLSRKSRFTFRKEVSVSDDLVLFCYCKWNLVDLSKVPILLSVLSNTLLITLLFSYLLTYKMPK